jgi:hypothetical protein
MSQIARIFVAKIVQSKSILNVLGILIALIGMGFVVNRIVVYQNQLNWSNFSEKTIAILILMIFVYGCANILLALAWQNILMELGITISFSQAMQIYGKSQLAKYVPGNVFQFAGRQALGVANNLPNRPLALSIFWELGWLGASGGIFFFLSLSLISNNFPFIVCLILFVFILCIFFWIARHFFSIRIAHAAILYVLFHFIAGSAFVIILSNFVVPLQFPGYVSVGGAYVIAWLLGMITPGVPGGVGIREMVLFWFLHGTIVPGDLLITIILSRIVTIGGDVLFFIFSFFWKPS